MKILLLSNKVPYPAQDGSSIAIESMIDGLLANKADVHLLSINTNKHYKSKNDILNNKPEKLKIEWVNVNTDITAVNTLKNLLGNEPFHVSRFWSQEFENKLNQKLKEEQFDLIQLEGLAMAVYLPLIKKTSKAKISLRAHNAEFQIWQRTAENETNILYRIYLKIQVKRLKSFELNILKEIDALVSITEEDLQTFKDEGYNSRGIAIPCGINTAESRNRFKTKAIYDITYIASFDWKPNVQGLEWFIEKVWPILKKENPTLSMALAGRKMPEKIESISLEGLDIQGEVESMPEFICSGKINIVPLLAGSGMRIKIIENMALSRPMVSTTIGAEGILVSNGKNIILEDDPSLFAKAIIDLLSDEKKRMEIGRSARKTIENQYSNKLLGKNLLNFYQTL